MIEHREMDTRKVHGHPNKYKRRLQVKERQEERIPKSSKKR
jgi:hypothetical protein